MRTVIWIGLLAASVSALVIPQTREGADQVAFPEGYRSWTHVKSMVIQEGHQYFDLFGGFHHVYGNDLALEALKRGGTFDAGAVLVFELNRAVTENNAVTEGPRLVVGVMQKDPVRFAATEGWGFEDFKGEDRTRAVTDARAQCLSCHSARRESDYVFSEYRW